MQSGYNGGIMYKAKPVIDNKFWIVEQNGERVGTIRKGNHNTLTMFLPQPTGVSNYKDMNELTRKVNIEVLTGKDLMTTEPVVQHKEVHGFPCKTVPYNGMYDVKRKLPLYTKTVKSQSFYCAGYYIIKFDRWLPSYCPKLLTLSRNDFQGPFKTKLEMQEALKRA